MTPAAEEVDWHAEVGEGHLENTGGTAMTVPPLWAMGEHSFACRLVRSVLFQRSLKYLYHESVEGCLVILRPTCQSFMEDGRHPNLEVDYGFGHCRLQEVLGDQGLTGRIIISLLE